MGGREREERVVRLFSFAMHSDFVSFFCFFWGVWQKAHLEENFGSCKHRSVDLKRKIVAIST